MIVVGGLFVGVMVKVLPLQIEVDWSGTTGLGLTVTVNVVGVAAVHPLTSV